MSALGQKRTCAAQKAMSALPPKADMCSATRHVRFVPKADIDLRERFQLQEKRQQALCYSSADVPAGKVN